MLAYCLKKERTGKKLVRAYEGRAKGDLRMMARHGGVCESTRISSKMLDQIYSLNEALGIE
jgi:hypothetical protein